MLFFVAVPLAALAGVFGESRQSEQVRSRDLHVRIEYADRLRYRQDNQLTVFITNRSASAIDTVKAVFDSAYVLGFSQAQFLPAAEPFIIPVIDLRPGQTKLITATMQADRYGVQRGSLSIITAHETVRLPLETLVFP